MRQDPNYMLTDTENDKEIDMLQWRQDIATFVNETNQELQEIKEQLGHDFGATRHAMSYRSSEVAQSSSQNNRVPSAETAAAGSTPTDARLAQLKQQLADRLERARSEKHDP